MGSCYEHVDISDTENITRNTEFKAGVRMEKNKPQILRNSYGRCVMADSDA